MFSATGGSGDVYFRFNSGGFIEWSGHGSNASSAGYFITNRKFRDYNGWYHFVIRFDSTQSTATDRLRFYVNGTQQESFSSYTNVNQNATDNISLSSNTHYWGGAASSQYFDGSMSHIHYTVGYDYGPDSFGETDSTTGEWKIKEDPSGITYGSAGYFILKDGAVLTDSSPNSNNFAVANGTLTKTEDCPSNIFSTLNPLYNQTSGQGVSLANGNTRCSYSPDSSRSAFGSIAVGTGKYYFEAKLNTVGTIPVIGVVDLAWGDLNGASGYGYHDNALNFGYNSSGEKTSGGTNTAFGSTFTAGDVIGVAIDKTNNKLYFAKNGTWQASGDPTSGSTGTGSAYNLASDTLYTSACRIRNGGDWSFNFGNGFFGTTAISSEGTNASGVGKFEYDVPAGYTALATKGLNE
tara:strand:- start:28 stop:1248 length:1221 start_codon:yes stop_codon:yes gene_type:complete